MNKVVVVNLGGSSYQLEELGYEKLSAYLERAQRSLQGNPDREEILADIEQSVGEKCRVLLGAHKNVVTAKELSHVLAEMGPVSVESSEQNFPNEEGKAGDPPAEENSGPQSPGKGSEASSSSSSFAAKGNGNSPSKRLYCVKHGAMLFGVCTGLQYYTKAPVFLWRILFILFAVCTGGIGFLCYAVLPLFIPSADAATEREISNGPVPTTQDLIRRAREGYYEALKGFGTPEERREWKKRFKQDMSDWKYAANSSRAGAGQARGPFRFDKNSPLGALLFISVLVGACLLLLFGVLAILSFLSHGSLFGLHFPAGLPAWLWIFIFFVLCQLILSPLFFVRSSFGCCGRRSCGSGCGGLIFGLLLVLGLSWWIFPAQTKSFVDKVPPTVNKVVDEVKNWWAEHSERK